MADFMKKVTKLALKSAAVCAELQQVPLCCIST